MSKYKKKKLVIILINAIIAGICVILNNMQTLGLLPVFVMMGCAFVIFANGLYYFANYDEEEKSFHDTLNDTGMHIGKGISNSSKKH